MRIFLHKLLCCLNVTLVTYANCIHFRHAWKLVTIFYQYRNINRLYIGITIVWHPLDPTNPTSTNVAWETLGIRRSGFSPDFRYSCRHSHFLPLHHSSRNNFTAVRTLPYHTRPLDEEISMFKFQIPNKIVFCLWFGIWYLEFPCPKDKHPWLRWPIWVPFILGADFLFQWAVTLSLKDGCF